MPVDNRHFIIEDLPDDPEDLLSPEDDDDDEESTTNMTTQPRPFQPQAPWQQVNPTPTAPATVWPSYRPPQPQPLTTPWTSFQQPRTIFQPQQQYQYQQTSQNKIDRRKKIIFCDLLDILIESESAVRENIGNQGYYNGANNYKKSGIMPRGLYDIRLKTEVWGKLAAFGADYIFCITNQPEKSKEDMETWKVMTDFVMYALADYLNLPHSNCKCLTKLGFNRSCPDVKPGLGLIKKALQTIPGYRYTRKDLVVIGVNSGYQNQSNIDRIMAEKGKIDYVDVNDLLTSYY